MLIDSFWERQVISIGKVPIREVVRGRASRCRSSAHAVYVLRWCTRSFSVLDGRCNWTGKKSRFIVTQRTESQWCSSLDPPVGVTAVSGTGGKDAYLDTMKRSSQTWSLATLQIECGKYVRWLMCLLWARVIRLNILGIRVVIVAFIFCCCRDHSPEDNWSGLGKIGMFGLTRYVRDYSRPPGGHTLTQALILPFRRMTFNGNRVQGWHIMLRTATGCKGKPPMETLMEILEQCGTRKPYILWAPI